MKKARIVRFIVTLFLIAGIGVSPLAAMESQGAEVTVTTKDGAQTKGRLTAVKWDALIVEDGGAPPGNEIFIAVGDLRQVQVAKKSKSRHAGLWGTMIGMGAGALVGALQPRQPGLFGGLGQATNSIGGLLLGGLLGLAIGAAIDQGSGGETFRFEDASKDERNSMLLRLSEYASLKGVR
jgi:hypothetical protein